MKILVTGGAGFIGLNLVLRLTDSRIGEVFVVDNLSVGQTSPALPDGVEFSLGDFRDRSAMKRALKGVDVVVHLAALSGVIDSVVDPRPTYDFLQNGHLSSASETRLLRGYGSRTQRKGRGSEICSDRSIQWTVRFSPVT